MIEEHQQESIKEIQRLHMELFRRVRYNLLDVEHDCVLFVWWD